MPLSAREHECLSLAAQGKTYRDIGMIIGLSWGTVKTYLDTARYKLNASNLPHAVAKAITLGFITIEIREKERCALESSSSPPDC